MLVVTVELHSAITTVKTVLARTIIHNVGTSANRKKADYAVAVGHKRNAENLQAVLSSPVREGKVEDYPRLSYNVWRLVIRALRSAFPEEDRRPSKSARLREVDRLETQIDELMDKFIAMTSTPPKASWDLMLYEQLCKALLQRELLIRKDADLDDLDLS